MEYHLFDISGVFVLPTLRVEVRRHCHKSHFHGHFCGQRILTEATQGRFKTLVNVCGMSLC